MSDEIKVHVVKYPDRDNYVMRYRSPINGKQVQRSTGTTNKRAADRAAGKWEAELREGRYKALCRMTWPEFQEKYEAEHLSGKADGTFENWTTVLNHVNRTIQPQRLAEMTTARLSAFVGKLRAAGMSETTIDGYLGHLDAALAWAVDQEYLRAKPKLPATDRADGVTKTMRGRPITLEELERMLAVVPKCRKREPDKWKRLLRGLSHSGLRLGEALELSWDDDARLSVDTTGKYVALRILADGQKNHEDKLLPISPEFEEFLLAVPADERYGLVFGIYGRNNMPLSTKRAGRYISAIGEKANVVTDKRKKQCATAHDLRRSFGTRWARRVAPAVLQALMRHASITTTMKYYVEINAEDIGDDLRKAPGTSLGTICHSEPNTGEVEKKAKQDTIST